LAHSRHAGYWNLNGVLSAGIKMSRGGADISNLQLYCVIRLAQSGSSLDAE
jgi:hypothetical protein